MTIRYQPTPDVQPHEEGSAAARVVPARAVRAARSVRQHKPYRQFAGVFWAVLIVSLVAFFGVMVFGTSFAGY